ncbi:MAG: bifunctional homocysteine S-methyltransferase/methylenetetrahydrofolate reductase [Verrucomicrobia bacterium]|nr:bifunctional homocysteine S-methyltransferase/methylenetetrahydrofolate reductase [Verrucomicrobiota bacterium]NDA25896.1 bifunctional homocysteine S-methyltransferase/methylenetetrahydrofolate reductase [Verrucomicrobiota bacterium]NDD56859.1 bifunctional homocysteine S-methyltransferase/methylenetetrahydrofolate reductase [Verrucomicrobiota bacterium]NDD81359.1 bifunctional homocysteine S-methyltransferase/methylenetetrahydrofolate reductase [Verrucomicrobiota bacterium]
MATLLEQMSTQVVVGDGDVAAYLYAKGTPLGRSFEGLCLIEADLIREAHRAYLEAGAELIATNSFGANLPALKKHGLEDKANEINWKAAKLALGEAKEHKARVAGCVGPSGWTAAERNSVGTKEVEAVFRKHAGALIDGGVEAVLLQSFSDPDELELAIGAVRELHHLPVIAMLASGREGTLPEGKTWEETAQRLRKAGADVVGVAPAFGPSACPTLIRRLSSGGGNLLAAYPDAGQPEYAEGRYLYSNYPEYFAERMAELPALGTSLLGGGSGVGPDHIRALKKKVEGLVPAKEPRTAIEPKREVIRVSIPDGGKERRREESILDRLKRERVAIVELDSPRNLDMGPFLKAAEELVKAGATALTLADNSLAILRVANTAAATLIRERFGVTSVVHLACRDKNLIGLQSELMGLAALGHRHVLALTGDPSKFGDHPGATSVYDVNSLGLIDLIRQINEGRNSAGRDVGKGAEFVIGVAFNPNSKNFDAQVKKLERKIERGAHFAMTQPVYEKSMIRKIKEALTPLGIPVLVGVMPVISARNAEFLHHEVPGISIPDEVRAKIRSLPEGPAQAEYGREVAAELAREVAQHFRGIYLITPMVRSGMTAPIVKEFLQAK